MGDSPVANGKFTVSKMWVLTVSTTGETSADEDKSAMHFLCC